MTTAAVLSSKSTTDRLPVLPFPTWIRVGFAALAAISPRAAAALGRRWFFTPIAARARRHAAAEAEALAQATPFSIATDRGAVQGYAWGHGPAVLLLHGWGGDARQMTSFVPAILARGCRAIALDMPAHGASAGRRSSLVHFSDAVEAAARVLGPLRGVIAHSFGAAATTYALARGLDAGAVAFIAPPVEFETFWWRFREGLGMSLSIWQRLVADAERWLGVRFVDIQPRQLAPSLATPLLVVHDAGDGQVLWSEGAELAALWPGARLETTRGLGHLKILRDARTIDEVADFVAARERA